MKKFFNEIKGMPVCLFQNGLKLGFLLDPIIDSETGQIQAFWVKMGYFKKPLILPVSEIVEWKSRVYIKNQKALSEPEEIIRVHRILSKGVFILGNQVRSIAGNYLGKVRDLSIDLTFFKIDQIKFTKTFLGFEYSSRIISYKNIVRVLPKYILINDDSSLSLTEVSLDSSALMEV